MVENHAPPQPGLGINRDDPRNPGVSAGPPNLDGANGANGTAAGKTPSSGTAKSSIEDTKSQTALSKYTNEVEKWSHETIIIIEEWIEKRCKAIWANLFRDHLWQRMVKNTLATTLAIIIGITPAITRRYGRATYLAAVTTVFGHPGRRFGQMAEAQTLAVMGALVGTAWATLAIYLSSLVYAQNPSAAFTIKGIFLTLAVLFHGHLRSQTPRLFLFVLEFLIVVVVSLTSPQASVSGLLVKTVLAPTLTAVAMCLLVNVVLFPEFSSDFLGNTTIETLSETVDSLRDAATYFISVDIENPDEVVIGDSENLEGSKDSSPDAESHSIESAEAEELKSQRLLPKAGRALKAWVKTKTTSKKKRQALEAEEKIKNEKVTAPKVVKLKSLTDSKTKLRAKLAGCKAAQQECMFEIAYAVLPPRDLKPISDTAMKQLVAHTISLISACESKYALLGEIEEAKQEEQEEKDKEYTGRTSQPQSRRSSMHESSAAETSADEHGSGHDDSKKNKRKKNKAKKKSRLQMRKDDLEMVKPQKEIEYADERLLRHLLRQIQHPLKALQHQIDRSEDVVTTCLAYCYDVTKLPNGSLPPSGIRLEEIDIHIEALQESMNAFDRDCSAALESAAAYYDTDGPQLDIMPRMETFLISSFLLNLRQVARHLREMMEHSRTLVDRRQSRKERSRMWFPHINWRKWLVTGGEQDSLALPNEAKRQHRQGTVNNMDELDDTAQIKEPELKKPKDVEATAGSSPDIQLATTNPVKSKSPPEHGFLRFRHGLADTIEALTNSDDFEYAVKLAVAVLLVTWPSFVAKWNTWYYLNRGLWAALQLVLITEVAIGASIWIFLLRVVGTTLGCCWGLAAYEAAHGHNRVVAVVMLVIGIIPSTYIQLGSKYVKAGMVSIISMVVVVLATFDASVPGTAVENFLRRLIAFIIGGCVAVVIEFLIYPVRARDRLVESLAAAIGKITEMEACLAHGIDSGKALSARSPIVTEHFEVAKAKAQGSLEAAETFLPFCAQEPRLKGSFAGLALVYQEVLFVLHQVVDRMDNMLKLRKEYESSLLEELSDSVYAYRRNLAGSITLTLFAVHEALTTKLPLPQFLPSARLAHLRLTNRVRELVLEDEALQNVDNDQGHRSSIERTMIRRVVRQKFLSWNAASAEQIEIIEYLEELVDLTKLLVGANEFRTGLLTRPTVEEYMEHIHKSPRDLQRGSTESKRNENTEKPASPASGVPPNDEHEAELADTVPEISPEIRRRRTAQVNKESPDGPVTRTRSGTGGSATLKKIDSNEEDLPFSLQRVRSRRIEERKMDRIRSNSSSHSGKGDMKQGW